MNAERYSNENVRKGIVHYLFGRLIAGLAGFATVILLVRYMDLQNYAAYTALSGLVMLSGMLGGLGLERAVARFVPEGLMQPQSAGLSRFIWMTAFIRLVASFVIAGLIYVSWQPISHLLKYMQLEHFPVAIVLFLIAENLFSHFSSIFQALMLQKMLTRLLCIQWAGRLVLILIVIASYNSIDVQQALWVSAIPECLGVLAFAAVLLQHLRKLPPSDSGISQYKSSATDSISWPAWRPVMQMSMHNYAFCLLAAPPQGYFMRMLVAVTLPVEIVAAYGFFLSIAEKVRQYIPLHFFYNIIEPVLIARYLQDKKFSLLSERCQTLYKFNLLLFIPAIVWVAAVGPLIIEVLTGGKFGSQTWILLVVMLQLLIGSHVVLLQLILNAINLSEVLVKASVYALFSMLIFLLVSSQLYMPAIIVAPVLFSLVMNIYVIFSLNKYGKSYKPTWRVFCAMSVAGILPLVAIVTICKMMPNINAMFMSIGSGLVVFLSFAVLAYVFKWFESRDLEFLSSIFKKNKPNSDSKLQA